jgi:hypothetical protein
MKYKRKKRFGKRILMGRTYERCVECGELRYCNHTKCPWCGQVMCYRVAFGIIFLDCEEGMIQRRNKDTGDIVTVFFGKGHWCQEKVYQHELMYKRVRDA